MKNRIIKGGSPYRIYHPTNKDTITKLVEYLETHGTLQQSAE